MPPLACVAYNNKSLPRPLAKKLSRHHLLTMASVPRRWMEACLGEELPAPTELEEALRNGVILAKLGHRFAPSVVPRKKIYDWEQLRYKVARSFLSFAAMTTNNVSILNNHSRCKLDSSNSTVNSE